MKCKMLAVLFCFSMVFCSSVFVSAIRYANVVIVGDLTGGKTSFWSRINDGTLDHIRPSLGEYRFFERGLANDSIDVTVWDTPGAREYLDDIIKRVIPGANFIFIVHDLTTLYSDDTERYFNDLYRQIQGAMAADGVILLVGAKSDSVQHMANVTDAAKNFNMLTGISQVTKCKLMILNCFGDSGRFEPDDNMQRTVQQIFEKCIIDAHARMNLPTSKQPTALTIVKAAKKEEQKSSCF